MKIGYQEMKIGYQVGKAVADEKNWESWWGTGKFHNWISWQNFVLEKILYYYYHKEDLDYFGRRACMFLSVEK